MAKPHCVFVPAARAAGCDLSVLLGRGIYLLNHLTEPIPPQITPILEQISIIESLLTEQPKYKSVIPMPNPKAKNTPPTPKGTLRGLLFVNRLVLIDGVSHSSDLNHFQCTKLLTTTIEKKAKGASKNSHVSHGMSNK
ncbi:MAG: hypothetical protein VYD53_18195 [Pseudomonadota bacterium]|nr:hypothetical protein [Pseudomonadota bacterium]